MNLWSSEGKGFGKTKKYENWKKLKVKFRHHLIACIRSYTTKKLKFAGLAPWQTPEIQTPELQTPKIQTPELQTPEIQTPEIQTPELQTTEIQTPEIQTTEIQTTES